MTDGQNTRDQCTNDRKSKHAWSNYILYIPFILSEVQTNAGLIHA